MRVRRKIRVRVQVRMRVRVTVRDVAKIELGDETK